MANPPAVRFRTDVMTDTKNRNVSSKKMRGGDACVPAIVRHKDGGVEYVSDDTVELDVVREASVAAAPTITMEID